MAIPVLFIHSGGPQGEHEGSDDLVKHLRRGLHKDHVVLYPRMPDPENPEYELWKLTLDRELSSLDDEVILVGHSLGASVLVKFLSEESCEKSIMGLFLVAPPFFGGLGWEVEEYLLRPDFETTLQRIPNIFLYHSRNDNVVPFNHLIQFAGKLPYAVSRVIENRGHLFTAGLPELVDDIRNLSSHNIRNNKLGAAN